MSGNSLLTEFDRMKAGGCSECRANNWAPIIVVNDAFAWCERCKSKVYDSDKLAERINEIERRLETHLNSAGEAF